jgi:hypothetical protein
MEFNIGDKVIIKSIKTKGEIREIKPRFNNFRIVYYIVDYFDVGGSKHSTGFKKEHLELDKQYYREKRIDDVLKGKVL